MKKIETKNSRVRRELAKREPQVVEGTKQALLLKGPKCSLAASKALTDMTALKKPDAKQFAKRNLTRPFEDQTSVEFLCQRNDTALFAFASSSKKRPHNLVMGRMFDNAVLDMVELGLDEKTFKTMKAFSTAERKGTVRIGSKAAFIFQGDEWQTNTDMQITRNVITDFFRGDDMEHVNLASLDRVIICSAVGGGKFLFRHYAVRLRKSGTKFPRVELDEVGPRMDLTFRRRKSASDDVRKQAMRVAAGDSSKPQKQKNIERHDLTGEKTGRVHMKHQDLSQIAHFKGAKALRKGGSGSKRKRSDGTNDTAADAADSAAGAAGAPAAAAGAGAGAPRTSAQAEAMAAGDAKPKKKERLKGQARWQQSKRPRNH